MEKNEEKEESRKTVVKTSCKKTPEKTMSAKKTPAKTAVTKRISEKKLRTEKNNSDSLLQKKPVIMKVSVRISVAVVLIFVFAFASFYAFKKITKVNFESKNALVSKQLSFCQELTAMKFQYSDIVTLKKSLGFSKSYSIVKYSGLVRAGLQDFSEAFVNVSKNGKKVSIKLPPVQILANEITSQEVFDEKQSIFVPITTQEIFDEIENAKNQMQEDMIASGILEETEIFTRKIVKQFMLSCGFEEVSVE